MNSRDKGKRGELEASKAWAALFGCDARRGQQFAGGTDSPDVVTSMEGIHLEVKRVERGNPYDWIDQAVADAQERVPLVLHRRSRREWLVVMRLTDVPRLAQVLVKEAEEVVGAKVPGAVPGARVPAPGVTDAGAAGVL